MELETSRGRAQAEKLAQGFRNALPKRRPGNPARALPELRASANIEQRIHLGIEILNSGSLRIEYPARGQERAGHSRLSYARGPRHNIGSRLALNRITHAFSEFRIALAKFKIAGRGLYPQPKVQV
jgi:hypothetical protein